ncbi:MAG: MgtC/SapB family protein [Phycisphaerales bacterium JB060]
MLETIFGPAMEAPDAWYQGPARLVLAVLFGAVAGFEREARGHFAGLRTYAMVSMGAAGFALISTELFEYMLIHAQSSAGHATRIISAIVGGIGFLGAGAIIQAGGKVHGLTTAAGLWAIAAAGAAAGLGLAAIALTIAGLCLLVLLANRLDTAARRMTSDGDGGGDGGGGEGGGGGED